jgi:hypothetical protein
MRKALVIGINDYPGSARLNGCVNDATAVANILRTHEDGSRNFDVELVTDISTKSRLTELVFKLFKGDHEVTLLYFSGHGSIDELDAYLATPDAQKFDLGLSVNNLLKMANDCESTNRIIILDCCHSGKVGEFNLVGGKTSMINNGVTILTASKSDESAMEIGGHGVFTNLLIESLKGGAANITGNITPGSIYAYIDQALGAHDQRPVFKTNITEFTSLRKVKPSVSMSSLRKITEYFVSPVKNFQLDPSFEYTNSEKEEHKVIPPYANEENVLILKDLQKYQSVGLVVPVDSEHMYYAAMESKSCKLTPLGYHYWRLVKEGKLE